MSKSKIILYALGALLIISGVLIFKHKLSVANQNNTESYQSDSGQVAQKISSLEKRISELNERVVELEEVIKVISGHTPSPNEIDYEKLGE